MNGSSSPTSPLSIVDGWDVPNVVAATFDADGIVDARGDIDRPFALASVSKVLGAIAMHVAVEEGTVALDDAAGPDGSTLAHLLAHASGLAPEAGTPPMAAVGTRRIYSNQGFDVAAAHVAARAHMSFAEYASAALVDTLGLAVTDVSGSPAHAYVSSARDVATIVSSVVGGRLLAADTLRAATTPAFPDLAGVLPGYGRQAPNPWGLGVEVRGTKSPHWTSSENSPATWGHFGRSGTFAWFDPAVGIGLVALTDRDFGPWAIDAWPPLSTAVLRHR